MAAKKLRVLLVELSPDDARRTIAKLEQGGYEVDSLRVDSEAALLAALARNDNGEEKWDVVLCSDGASGFCGFDALKLMQEQGIDLPFLFMSHDLREENIVRAMQSGAGDYIFKGSLSRLVSAIEHNLREADIRREYRLAQRALQVHQTRLQAFISNLPGMAYQLRLARDGEMSFPYVSEGSHALLGLNYHELEQHPELFLQLLHPEDVDSYHQSMLISAEHLSLWNWEGRIVMQPAGEIKWINLRCSPRKLDDCEVQWEGIMSNISQSRLAEIELKHSREQLRELSSHIQDVREQERINIAREVHDDMGGTLTAIKLDIAWLGGHLDAKNVQWVAKVKSIEALVDRCINSANNISRTLRPSVLDSFGLIAAIEIEAEEFEQRTGISCPVNHVDEGGEISPDTSIALFRIFQEALTNIIKHAQATQVKVDIYNRNGGVELIVSDNGRGLQEIDRLKPRSFGLRGIQERVAYFNGKVSISSASGAGTTVAVLIPRAQLAENVRFEQSLS
ncbi:MAG: ATP-binding protein [Pseudomonadota bacterium]